MASAPFGLVNLGGNTCYMNTVFQVLLHDEFLLKELGTGPLALALIDLKKNANQTSLFSQCKQDLGKLFDFREENDMHEFYLALVNKLCEQEGKDVDVPPQSTSFCDLKWLQDNKKEYSSLLPIFKGQFKILCKCNECEYVCKNAEVFMSIDLDVNANSSIEAMMAKYFLSEHLDHWTCDNCNKTNAKKLIKVRRAPKTLAICIKRFNDNSHVAIDIPDSLKFHHCHYTLFAIGAHQGNQHGGHYYALVFANNKWYIANDNIVLQASEHAIAVAKRDAYMLFYNIRTPDLSIS
jgi:ubiquitin C-terminal hydrolase